MLTYLASIVFALVSIAFIVLAAIMNWKFGESLGRSPFDQTLFAAVGLGVDIAKMLLPFLVYWAIKNRRLVVALLAGICLVAVITYSVAGLAGYVDLARAAVTGNVTTKKDAAVDLRTTLRRKQAQLAELTVQEPPSVIESRLARLRQDTRWQASKDCALPYSRSMRRYCQGYADLVSDLTASQSAEQLASEIASLRRQLATLSTIENVNGPDPRVEIAVRLWGWERLLVQTGLGLLLVGIVEFMSTFGIFIAFNHGELGAVVTRWKAGRQIKQEARTGENQACLAEDSDFSPEQEAGSDRECTWNSLAGFAVGAMLPQQGSEIAVAELYPHYADWCGRNGFSMLELDDFIEAFEIICEAVEMPLRRNGTSTYCRDVKLAA